MSRNKTQGRYVGCYKGQHVRLGKYTQSYRWMAVVKSKQSRYVLEERYYDKNSWD